MTQMNIDIKELQKRSLFIGTPMYGGKCDFIFSKGMNDTAATLAKNDIPFKIHTLANESLIQRARNYIADEFMRSGMTHMLFIDSDIGFGPRDVLALLAYADPQSDYDVVCGPYPKKCCHSATKVITEDGKQTIAKIVRESYKGKVLSVNSVGQFEWRNVSNHWREKNYGKKWVSLKLQTPFKNSKNTPKGCMVITDDHEVAYIDNLLYPKIKYTSAKNMGGKYVVQTKRVKQNVKRGYNYNRYPLLNKEQVSALLGMVLGDGYISPNGGYAAKHGNQQYEYARHKHDLIGGRFYTKDVRHTFKNGQTDFLRNLVYVDGKKTLKNVVHLLDEISLAYLYMDDGNRYYYPTLPSKTTNERTWWYNKNTNETVRRESSPGVDWCRGRKSDV